MSSSRSPAYLLPFEVKYRENAPLDPKGGLATYCALEKITQAYLVTKREGDFGVRHLEGVETQLLGVPAHILCYLLGQAERVLWE